MPRLILIRHGESEWNRDNRFTGWVDVGLTELGYRQMFEAGALMKNQGVMVDLAFTSMLTRCIRSQWALLEGLGRVWVPIQMDWRLNERHYGALTGLAKASAVEKFGAAKVQIWRRSFDVRPPTGNGDACGFPMLDQRYAAQVTENLPQGESLAMVVERVRPLWTNEISQALRSGKKVAITAHGNSLRALLKLIIDISDEQIANLEFSNARPMTIDFDNTLTAIRHSELTT